MCDSELAVSWSSVATALSFDGAHDVHSFHDFAEDNMLAVQPWRLHGCDEELRSVAERSVGFVNRNNLRVLSGVGHAQLSAPLVT